MEGVSQALVTFCHPPFLFPRDKQDQEEIEIIPSLYGGIISHFATNIQQHPRCTFILLASRVRERASEEMSPCASGVEKIMLSNLLIILLSHCYTFFLSCRVYFL